MKKYKTEVRDNSVPKINSKYKGTSIVGISRFNGSFDILIGENGDDFMNKFLENFYSSENLDYYLVKVYSRVHFKSIKPVLNRVLKKLKKGNDPDLVSILE